MFITWISKLKIPWSVIHCPLGCPLSSYQVSCNDHDNYGKININTPNKKYLVISVNHNFSSGLTTTIKIRPLEK